MTTSATQAYRQRVETIRVLLRLMEEALSKHEVKQAADPKNWGYPGDLTEVMVHMREALNMLGY